ncbi:F-BAR domain only protein 1 [Trachemys scripta elegans]|uniref:F-BAR domain only protein 1 n=1 Tax=Trachemys scripta elegans TaxID=31138 RepID=UPI00155351F9|nr:F-BAR domain only protein 1 [Trachemys scripta elegans]
MSCFGEHFWGEKNQGFDVLYHNMKHGQVSTKELADFVRERATVEETYGKSMAKLAKMATNGTQLGTFAPLWEVFRVSSDKLALCHLELVKKLQDLLKEIARYGEEQGKAHKKCKEEVSGTLEAIQLLQGVAQLVPKSKENYQSKCLEAERLRREGTNQKELDKAERKSKKAAEALRRAVEKYNIARADFEQRMLDSAVRFQELEESHLRHMKGLISSYSHSVEDTHVQIGQVSAAGESPDTDLTCPDVDEEGFTVRPDLNQSSSGGTHGCSSSDSDYEDEDEPRKFYVRIKPLQPCDAAGSGQAAVEQLKATVGNLPLPPSTGGTVKRQVCRHLPVATTITVNVGSDVALGTGEEPGKLQPPHPAAWTPSCAGKPRPDAVPSAALFGPPLESAFEAEDFPASRACGLGSSPSPFSSSSPENVEDSGLDSPSHPPTGPSPDSRPWTPQSPLTRRSAKGSPRLQEERGVLPPTTAASEEQSAWLPPPASPTGWPQDTPCFAAFGEDSGAGSQHDSRCPSTTAPSPDPSGDPEAWAARPPSPGSEEALQPCKHGACPPSHSSASPVPHSCREPSGPSPWTPQGPGPRLSDSSTPAAEPDPPPAPAPPSAAPKVAPPRRSRTKRLSTGQAACSHSDPSRSLCPSPLWNSGPFHSAPASLGERSFFTVSQPALGLSRGPSPVVLGSQDALPVATAFTEYIHAYFKGQDPDSCLVKITGELTMSFPAGIVRVFSGSPSPPVLSFRLLNTAPIEQFLPSAELLYSDPSQSDPSTKDFWLNMPALTGHLQKQAEQAPAASYYNVALLKYQFSKLGPSAAPLQLAVRWDCTAATTQVSVEYGYNAGAMPAPRPLTNVQVLLPVEEPVANVRLQPAASWNLEEKRLLWRLLDVPGAPDRGGCGHLSASWEPLYGPSKPSPVAAQFTSEGSTLSGVEVELAGSGYRMSLVKKRFATGIYLAGS